jgi:hypothetical protein
MARKPEEYLPPTQEQWQRLSPWSRWKIFFLVLRELIPYHLAEFGLLLGGLHVRGN